MGMTVPTLKADERITEQCREGPAWWGACSLTPPLAPGSPGCAGAATSRAQLGAPPGHPLLGWPLRPTAHLKPLPHPRVSWVPFCKPLSLKECGRRDVSRGSSCDIRPPPWWPVGNYLKSENSEPRNAPPRQAVLREEAPNFRGISESLHSVSF